MGKKDKTRSRGRSAARFLIVALAAMLLALLVSGSALAADRWTDITDLEWVSTYHVTASQAATVAEGYDDGTFRPGLSINRGQISKMVVDGLSLGTATPAVQTFSDVPPSYFYYQWIEGGVDAGIISGFVDGTYRPGSAVSRQQANSILGLYLAQKEMSLRGHIAGDEGNYVSLSAWYAAEGAAVLSEFADATSVATVHKAPTAYLAYHNVVQGAPRSGGIYLSPGSNLTRAQAVALILRVKAVAFTTALPMITLVNPNSGPTAGGNSVVITGTNFTGATVVKFGLVDATGYVVNSATQITAVAPAGTAGSTVDIRVTTPAGTSLIVVADKYSYGIPTVTLLNPAAGPVLGGNSVVITGTNFIGLSGATAVKFGTKNATSYVVNSATQITAVAPSGTAGTTVDVIVTTPAGASAASAASKYSYGIPTVTALNPAAGSALGGTTVVITGTGFTGLSGASAVKFGTKNATSYVVDSPTQITAVAPSGTNGTTVDVTVTNPVGTSLISTLASKYSYGVPTVTLVNPAAGPAIGGNTVIITGTGFTGVSGPTAVKFGTKNATSYVVDSPTQITAIAPSGTAGTTVDVIVTNAYGACADTLADNYSYGAPAITAVTPGAGPAAGGTAVTITGTGFSGVVAVTGVTFGGGTHYATSVVLSEDGHTITCVAPSGTLNTTVDVAVTTPAGTTADTLADNYSYGAPVITAVSPGAGPTAGNTVVTITGTGFSGVNAATGVIFGATPHYATNVVLSEDGHTITCRSPSGTSGSTVDIRVVNPVGTSAIVPADRYTYGTLHFVVSGIDDPATAGTASDVTVTVKDASDATVTGYKGTVHFTSNDLSAEVLPADYTFTTGDAGVHAFPDGVTLKTAGSITVTVTDTAVPGFSGSQTVDVEAGTAAKLTFGMQPSNAVAGAAIAPAMTVRIEDTYGNLVDDATDSVGIAIDTNAGSGTLSGTTPKAAVNGVATFSDLSIDKTGTGYTLEATATGLSADTSSGFNITPATAAKLTFGMQPSNAVAGAAIAPAVTVRIEDTYGNLVDDDTTEVGIAIDNDAGGGTLSGDVSKTAVNGVATFSDLSIDKTGTGYTLEATATGLSADTSSGFNITPAALDHFVFSAIGSQTSGVAFDVTITAYDSYDNVKTDYVGSADLTVNATSGSPVITPTTATFSAGVWSGSGNVEITGGASTGVVITATDGSISDDSDPFDVSEST